MKKTFLASLSLCSILSYAQDPYLNNTTINSTDLFGTSRFVAMGGAIGALGADISVINSNPAGIAMISKTDISLTAGTSWQGRPTAADFKSAFANFDQVGGVLSIKDSDGDRSFNLAFNYQKKADFNNSFYGEIRTQASWADQLNNLAQVANDRRTSIYDSPNDYNKTLYFLADNSGLFPYQVADIRKTPNDLNSTLSRTTGSLDSYNFNFSYNINTRFFIGATLSIDNLNFNQYTEYWEERNGYWSDLATNIPHIEDFAYINEQKINGNGFNFKLGAIVRPFESSSFRIGLAIESPTWYTLKYNDNQSITTRYYYDEANGGLSYDDGPQSYHDHYAYDLDNSYINYLEYNLSAPWRFRAQLGSTVSNFLAWGLEYEFANYASTKMSFPGQYGSDVYDKGFHNFTKLTLKPQHSLRAGIEVKPTQKISLRAGYNFISSTTSPGSYWDPYNSNQTLRFPTGLDYMNLSHTHIGTFGIGFRLKHFYADFVYKYRHQTGEYYPFNSVYEYSGKDSEGKVYTLSSNIPYDPINVNMSRHTINATIGFRF